MKKLSMLAAVALLGFGCGSVQDEVKKPEPVAETCTDAPGKVHVILTNDAGAAICRAEAAMSLQNGQEGSQSARNLGEVDGKKMCGFVFDAAGSATIKAPGMGEAKVSWSQPGKCQTNEVKVTLKN
ncbi:MAG: hypothetical protein R3F60_10650 [bacterium]